MIAESLDCMMNDILCTEFPFTYTSLRFLRTLQLKTDYTIRTHSNISRHNRQEYTLCVCAFCMNTSQRTGPATCAIILAFWLCHCVWRERKKKPSDMCYFIVVAVAVAAVAYILFLTGCCLLYILV